MKKRLLPLLILIFVLTGFNACRWNPNLLSEQTTYAAEPITEADYSIHDMTGKRIPYYNVSKAMFDPELFMRTSDGRVVYNDAASVAFAGVDVSVHQDDIDWQAVRNDGISFAFIRAAYRGYGTKGKINTDENFRKNVEGALAAGLHVGVYFFSQAVNEKEAVEEADYILSLIKGYPLTYPIVFDWERYDIEESRTYTTDSKTVTACAKAFCDRIRDAGYRPMIYLNCEIGYFDYDLEVLQEYDCWLAQYNDKPTYYYHYTIWQYTESGKVDGIDGPVDLNICLYDYGSESLG
ncbi:MAG: glycoside hydrolase family 25 protein [Clostridia bacterium]|nr:glycoside hydrolase family 25 protein [Clostridia bacterium]